MKVTLVSPPYTFWKPGTEFLAPLLGHYPPMGLLSLAAYVREHLDGITFTVIDAAAQALSRQEAAREVVKSAPDVVGITMTTSMVPDAEAIARAIKTALPRVPVVVGGPHVSGVGAAMLSGSDAFDLAVVGEGELTFRQVLEALRAGRPVGGIAGTLYRDNGQVEQAPPREPVADLDSLPTPAFDLLPDFPRAYRPNIFFSPGGPTASLVTSRGCPFQCAFCDQSTFGHSFRAASAESVFATVRNLRERYGVRYLVFYDDMFTLDRGRVMELCRLMTGLKPRLAWSCDANVMTVDREMLREMKRAGCWSISFGLESGSPRILRSLRKEIDLGRARQVVQETHAAGIRAKGLFILGTPEESVETIDQTRAFIRALPLSSLNLSKFTPYPGSELHDRLCKEHDFAADGCAADYGRLNGMNFIAPSKYLSIEELEREYEVTLRRFYKTPRTYINHLCRLFGRWQNIRRLAGVSVDVIKARLRRKRNAHSGDVS